MRLEEDRAVAARSIVLATGAQYRRLPVYKLAEYEGLSVFYAAGPPEGKLCAGERVGVPQCCNQLGKRAAAARYAAGIGGRSMRKCRFTT